MIQLKNIQNIYFIGIGGIGMSAIARFFASHGVTVKGYDKTPTVLTREMEKEGIDIHYEDNVELLDKDAQLVVYTPAMPADHKELNYYRDHNYKVVKRSDVLQAISERTFNICVAGTHGKTTISTMIAHILHHSGYGCTAFLGGVAVNYNSNYIKSGNDVCVIEADEYDRSFLKLSPDIGIISAMDADHLDIYGTEEAMQDAFIQFTERVKVHGLLLTKSGLKREDDFVSGNHLRYGLTSENADIYAENIKTVNGGYHFDVVTPTETIHNIVLNMGGLHNVENAVAAIAVAMSLKISRDKIRKAVADFKGVRRRFQYVARSEKMIMIDDYAHHPEELRALIDGAKKLFKGMKCTVVFQPHLFSRTRDLAIGFAESLDKADEVILLPVYPARELPIPGVTSHLILDLMSNKNAQVLSKTDLLTWVTDKSKEESQFELFITAGAGDIDLLVDALKTILVK